MAIIKPLSDRELQDIEATWMDQVIPSSVLSNSVMFATLTRYRLALHRATGDLCWEPDECPQAVYNWAASPCRGGSCPLPAGADHGPQSRLCWAEYYLREEVGDGG